MHSDESIFDACSIIVAETKQRLALSEVAAACNRTPEEVTAALIRASNGRVIGFNLPATHITYINGQSAE